MHCCGSSWCRCVDEFALEVACQIEGHPDNVAPALFGGLIVCANHHDHLIKVKFPAGGWKALVVIPNYEVSTQEARKVLPTTLERNEVVQQVSHAMLFEYAWVHEQEELLKEVCHDFIHEPYRAKLIADYQKIRDLADQYGVPFWISGSGSTMALISQDLTKLNTIQAIIESFNSRLDCRVLNVCNTGAEVIYG